MNASRITAILLGAILAICVILWLRERSDTREQQGGMEKAMTELRGQIELQNQALAGLRAQMESLEWNAFAVQNRFATSALATSSGMESWLMQRVNALDEQQSNTLAILQRQFGLYPVETPEQAKQRMESGLNVLQERLTEQQTKLETASQRLDELRVSLTVPDEIAVMEVDKALDDPRLANYRAYFESKQSRDRMRGFARILEMKLAAERLDAALPISR